MAIPIASPKKVIKQQVEKAVGIWQRPLFKDRLFIGFIVLGLLLSLAVVVVLMVKVRSKTFVVPLQYSTLQGFDSLGPWYRVYVYGLFTLLVTIINITLAVLSYSKSRIASFFLVLGMLVINLLTLVVIVTLAGHLD